MFHLSLPVDDLAACEAFYSKLFDALVVHLAPGSSNIFVFGAQLTLHERPGSGLSRSIREQMHFGHVVSNAEWAAIRDRLSSRQVEPVSFVAPNPSQGVRGKIVVADPSGNLVEINSDDGSGSWGTGACLRSGG